MRALPVAASWKLNHGPNSSLLNSITHWILGFVAKLFDASDAEMALLNYACVHHKFKSGSLEIGRHVLLRTGCRARPL